ncbi:MAG: hypothetical protein H7Y00_16605 [Fimbriimonadaceae bacterium]|nr:hypothetical protein [Chitinophagales bacterium]
MSKSFVIVLCIVMVSCNYHSADSCITSTSFINDVYPIIINNCSLDGCHVSGSVIGNLADYDILKQKVDEGKLYYVLFENPLMPPDTMLKENDLKIIECWLKDGAQNN